MLKVLAEDRDLPLYGSGGFRLMWDTKFDAGMCAFLDCLQQFKVGGTHLQSISQSRLSDPACILCGPRYSALGFLHKSVLYG